MFPRRSEVFRERVRVKYIALRVPVFDHVLVPGVQGGGTDRRALPVVVLGTVSSFPADGFVERGEPRFSEDLVLYPQVDDLAPRQVVTLRVRALAERDALRVAGSRAAVGGALRIFD